MHDNVPPRQPPPASAEGIARFIPAMPTSVDKGAPPITGSLPAQQLQQVDVSGKQPGEPSASSRREVRRGRSSKVLGVIMAIGAFVVGVLLTSLIVPMIVKTLQ